MSIPHEDCKPWKIVHPSMRGGEGVARGAIPPAGGSGDQQAPGRDSKVKLPKEKLPCKIIL